MSDETGGGSSGNNAFGLAKWLLERPKVLLRLVVSLVVLFVVVVGGYLVIRGVTGHDPLEAFFKKQPTVQNIVGGNVIGGDENHPEGGSTVLILDNKQGEVTLDQTGLRATTKTKQCEPCPDKKDDGKKDK